MVVFRKRFVTLAEQRFGPPTGKGYRSDDYPGVDAVSFLQSPTPVPGAFSTRSTSTLVCDLNMGVDELYSRCHATTRKEINRASEKDHLTYHHWRNPTPEQIKEFRDFFGKFAAIKG